MRVLVIGGAGFIGSHFVEELLAASPEGSGELEVTILDKFTYAGSFENLAHSRDRCNVVRGDLCDPRALRKVVPGADLVVNFAAETHVDRSIRDPKPFMDTNTLGVATLMEECLRAGTPRIVQVSTDEVYGSISEGSWDEGAPLSPNSPYAAAKAGGDLIALAYHRTHGLPVIVTRCGNNYGPRQFPEKLIPLFVTRLLEGLQVPLYGDGLNVRDWIHVSDHCAGIRLAALRGEPGEVYHVGGTGEASNLDITRALLRVLGRSWQEVERVPDRLGHDFRYSLDDTRLRNLGYRPLVGLQEGIEKTVRWYADNPSWWEPLRKAAALV